MGSLEFTYNSTGYLSGAIFSSFLFTYLMFLKGKTRQTWFLALYFLFIFILSAGFLVRTSFFLSSFCKPSSFAIAVYTAFANLALMAFVYSFPRNVHRKESIAAFVFILLSGVAAYFYYVYSNANRVVYYNFETLQFEFQNPDSARPMGMLHLLTFVWILSVVVRKIIYEEKEHRRHTGIRAGNPFRLTDKNARALRAFGLAVFLHTCFSFTYVLYTAKIISFADFQTILTNVLCIQLFIYAVIYINNSPQPSSFMVKIVGVSLLAVLLVLSLVSRITFQNHERSFYQSRAAEIQSVRGILSTGDFTNLSSTVEYLAHRQPRSDSGYTIIFRKTGAIESRFFDRPGSRTEPGGMERSDAVDTPGKESIHRTLGLPGDPSLYFLAWEISLPGGVFETGIPYEIYKKSVHRIVLQIIAAMLFTSFVFIILLPLFFFSGLVRPLAELIGGVKRVNDGDYRVSVEPQTEDEVGYLTRSFNGMVDSIRQSQKQLQEYTDKLEQKVQERTVELSRSLDEIRHLKGIQDADYFLTSLLIEPLSQNRAKSNTVAVEALSQQLKKFKFGKWNAEIGGDLCVSGNLILNGRPCTVFLNGDAMGKSIQGAAGALVLGSVFEAMLERSVRSSDFRRLYPERWLKNAFIELHNTFTSFNSMMLVSMVLGLIDEETGFLYFVNAEHPLPVLLRRGKAEFLQQKFQYTKLGMSAGQGKLYVNTCRLRDGDSIITGSDGRDNILIQDSAGSRMNDDEHLFLKIVESTQGELAGMIKAISEAGTITDDISLMRVTYSAPEVSRLRPSRFEMEQYANARRKFNRGDYEGALKILEKTGSDDEVPSKNSRYLKLLALSNLRLERYEKAVRYALSFSWLHPEDGECLYIISFCYLKIGDLQRAADFGERLRLRGVEHQANLLQLQEIYRKSGDISRANSIAGEAKGTESLQAY